MPGSPPPAGPFVYQVRVVLRGVSPLIWRRLLVHSDSTLADLHAALQLAFGWSDEHLNRFVIHGVITTVAGSGDHGARGDGGPATQASFFEPRNVAIGSDGSLYIADDVD